MAVNLTPETSLDDLPREKVEAFVRDLAKLHGISARRTHLDEWADAVADHADAYLRTDEIDDLFVALAKAGVLTSRQMIQLLGSYMDEQAS